MKYRVAHDTTYNYGDAVPVCHNYVHLTPRDTPRQVCRSHKLVIKPAPAISLRRLDYFGNQVTYFSLHEGHRKLSLTAVSRVDVRSIELAPPADSPPWEEIRDALSTERTPTGLEAYQFVFPSAYVDKLWGELGQAMAEYALKSFTRGRPIVEAALDLTARIHADFRYDATATNVFTPLEEVFRLRHGVCQDLAHVQIGVLRAIGLAARYVSGYLLTHPPPGRPRLVGADASHAWLAVYCGAEGWVDFDPTNNVIPSDEHITLAWGRDYGDVCPVAGVFVGGGANSLLVSVDVAPQDGVSAAL
ncbi:MAG TPA: transglutaminase family protein [Pirellulaceae bacterium]|nr:transglutaminase family protein [Pirellulaceae bacterium]